MAISQVASVAPRRPTKRTVENKRAKGFGNVLGGVGAVAGGLAGTGFGGTALGAVGGMQAGQSLGHQLGGGLQKTITEAPAPQASAPIQTPQGSAAPPVVAPNIQLSAQGQEMHDTLQIVRQLPPEIGLPHEKTLISAIMADVAQNNSAGRA